MSIIPMFFLLLPLLFLFDEIAEGNVLFHSVGDMAALGIPARLPFLLLFFSFYFPFR